jgi:hypothetical protein
MPISDIYTAKSGIVTIAASTITAAVSLVAPTTKRSWVVGVRVNVALTTAAAGNNCLFQLARPALSTEVGTSPLVATPHDVSAPAALTLPYVTWSTAPTLGTVLWEQELPQTTGSSWEEFPPSGYEWGIPATGQTVANAGVHMFITQSVATSTTYLIDLIFSE